MQRNCYSEAFEIERKLDQGRKDIDWERWGRKGDWYSKMFVIERKLDSERKTEDWEKVECKEDQEIEILIVKDLRQRNHNTGKKEETEKYVERSCYSETFEADGILDTAKKDKGREEDCYRLKENKFEEENFDREKR